jgi:CelD/BcsL family acetyltransferase involved in cellulose biosynthesis
MSNLSVEIIRGLEALAILRPEWKELFDSSAAAPFLAWEWAATWHKWFGQEKSPYIVCVREQQQLIGLLALCEEETRVMSFGPRVRKLSFLGQTFGAPDYLDILTLNGEMQRCAIAIFEHLAESGDFDLLELESLSADSLTLPTLSMRFGDTADFCYQIAPFYVCPQMTLDGDWEHVLGKTRRPDYFKYCMRRLGKIRGFEFRVVSDVDQVPNAFARFLELHEGRWKDRGDSAATSSPTLKGFMQEVVLEFARAGRLRFEEIWLEDNCRASLFGIESGGGYHFYLSGFDQTWAKYSLGFVLVGLSIRDAVGRGLKYYDFLRGAENYKFDWAHKTRMTVNVHITNNSQAARWSVAQVHAKEMTRALLPESIKVFSRRLRRKITPATPGGRLADQNHSQASPHEADIKDLEESAGIAVASS